MDPFEPPEKDVDVSHKEKHKRPGRSLKDLNINQPPGDTHPKNEDVRVSKRRKRAPLLDVRTQPTSPRKTRKGARTTGEATLRDLSRTKTRQLPQKPPLAVLVRQGLTKLRHRMESNGGFIDCPPPADIFKRMVWQVADLDERGEAEPLWVGDGHHLEDFCDSVQIPDDVAENKPSDKYESSDSSKPREIVRKLEAPRIQNSRVKTDLPNEHRNRPSGTYHPTCASTNLMPTLPEPVQTVQTDNTTLIYRPMFPVSGSNVPPSGCIHLDGQVIRISCSATDSLVAVEMSDRVDVLEFLPEEKGQAWTWKCISSVPKKRARPTKGIHMPADSERRHLAVVGASFSDGLHTCLSVLDLDDAEASLHISLSDGDEGTADDDTLVRVAVQNGVAPALVGAAGLHEIVLGTEAHGVIIFECSIAWGRVKRQRRLLLSVCAPILSLQCVKHQPQLIVATTSAQIVIW
ncbi:hypothetical protein HK104_002753 [Borealophlyctis nickersoniae]|nr:hypothetical protein HK104_002753 [Borealophlyctis nickersoniae]